MAWNVTGQLFELCNCNVVCGCWFGPTKPDQGWCGGALIFAIHQGAADGINLGGRKIALAAEWPGDFWSGNGKARLYVDAEAALSSGASWRQSLVANGAACLRTCSAE
jgi:hypothetical protein